MERKKFRPKSPFHPFSWTSEKRDEIEEIVISQEPRQFDVTANPRNGCPVLQKEEVMILVHPGWNPPIGEKRKAIVKESGPERSRRYYAVPSNPDELPNGEYDPDSERNFEAIVYYDPTTRKISLKEPCGRFVVPRDAKMWVNRCLAYVGQTIQLRGRPLKRAMLGWPANFLLRMNQDDLHDESTLQHAMDVMIQEDEKLGKIWVRVSSEDPDDLKVDMSHGRLDFKSYLEKLRSSFISMEAISLLGIMPNDVLDFDPLRLQYSKYVLDLERDLLTITPYNKDEYKALLTRARDIIHNLLKKKRDEFEEQERQAKEKGEEFTAPLIHWADLVDSSEETDVIEEGNGSAQPETIQSVTEYRMIVCSGCQMPFRIPLVNRTSVHTCPNKKCWVVNVHAPTNIQTSEEAANTVLVALGGSTNDYSPIYTLDQLNVMNYWDELVPLSDEWDIPYHGKKKAVLAQEVYNQANNWPNGRNQTEEVEPPPVEEPPSTSEG